MMRTTLITAKSVQTEHDEHTFRSLLDLEHRRCRQSAQAFHVLLCRLSTQDGMRFPMNESVKRALVSAMRESLGKNDQIGWFLQDLVLGALLLSLDPWRSAMSNTGGTGWIRQLIEDRFSHAHPSVVIQFYDYLDLSPGKGNLQDQTVARPC